jgi:hypothetical protein
VEPKEKLPGSTSVACWLLALVKLSELNCVSGTVAGGSDANGLLGMGLEFGLEPQLTENKIAVVSPKAEARRRQEKCRRELGSILTAGEIFPA